MEYVIALSEYLCIVMCILVMIKLYNSLLKYYQQSHYHLSSFKKIFKNFYLKKNSLIIYPLIIAIFFLDIWYVQIITSLYLGFILWWTSRKKEIVKLKFTFRIIRQYILIIVLDIALGTLLMMAIPFKELMSEMCTLCLLAPVFVGLSGIIIYPIEYLISYCYQVNAKKKLLSVAPFVIAITGSFGKTSTKDFIYQVLVKQFRTTKSPNSYNSLNGIALTINNFLEADDKYLVLEMGASHPKDLEKSLKVVTPNIAIVTTIGAAHLENFKKVENIVSEKLSIINALDEAGIAFVDSKYKDQCNTKAKVITFGYQDADYLISDVKVFSDHITFKINHHNTNTLIISNLVGAHNALNLTIAFAVLYELGIKENLITDTFTILEKTPHRLEEKTLFDRLVLDDSYNSNFTGFKNALEILKLYQQKKIIITPGIVEVGSKEQELNRKIAKRISEVCDEAYIISSPTGDIIYQELKNLNYSNVHKCMTFKQAINACDKEAIILIENDLPDYYFI